MTMKVLILTLLLVLTESMATVTRHRIYDTTESVAMQWVIKMGRVAGPSPPYYKNLTRPHSRLKLSSTEFVLHVSLCATKLDSCAASS